MPDTISLNWPAALRAPGEFHLDQFSVRLTGAVECVTTSVAIARNMMNELLASRTGKPPLPDLIIQDYVAALDGLGWRGIFYRVPSRFPDLSIPLISKGKFSPRGFMLPRSQALFALRRLAAELRNYYGVSFRVRQTARNTLEDIAANLRAGNLVLLSGLYRAVGKEQELLGGSPHTYGPVTEVDFAAGTITALDTGASPLNVSTFEEFLHFWDRKSLLNLHTRPRTMTVLAVETPS